jgi:hypothetical protein
VCNLRKVLLASLNFNSETFIINLDSPIINNGFKVDFGPQEFVNEVLFDLIHAMAFIITFT